MHDMLSRKERQLRRFEKAASEGKTEVTLTLYPSEARYWVKRGGIYCNMDNVTILDEKSKLGIYTFSFENSFLMHSVFSIQYVNGTHDVIYGTKNLGEQLYLQSQRVVFTNNRNTEV